MEKKWSNGSSSSHLSVGCSLVKDRLSLVASGDYCDALLEHSLYLNFKISRLSMIVVSVLTIFSLAIMPYLSQKVTFGV